MKKRFVGIAALAVLCTSTTAFAQQMGTRSLLTCGTVSALEERVRMNHVGHKKWSEDHLNKMVDLYADSVDPGKVLYTVDEFASFKAEIKSAFKGVHQGKCDAYFKLHKDQIKRQADMESFVRDMSKDKKLAVDKTIELHVDVDKRPRPATTPDRNALREKVIQFQLATYLANGTEMKEAKEKLTHRYELITRRLKEEQQPDQLTTYLRTYTLALDPHSTYFSPEDLEDFRISMALSLEGIGAVLRSRDGYTIVEEVVQGGAAARQGQLERHDKIIAVAQKGEDPVDVIDMSLRDVVRMIRGKKDTTVILTVLRQGEKTETLQIEIQRDKIDLKQQAAKLRMEKVKRGGKELNLAIIELPSFYGEFGKGAKRSCDADVKKLLLEAKAKNADGVVLDLSTNGGGVLDGAVKIAGLFIARGAVVGVSVPGVKPDVLDDIDSSVVYDGPLVILTSRGSASASEIVAGALKDYNRAIIVGDDQTFGKGTVQNVLSLPPGFGALKVTTQMFFLPGGKSTQHGGVSADIVIPSLFSGIDIGERFQDNALPPAQVPNFVSEHAKANRKGESWIAVTAKEIDKLKAASAKRVAASKEFKDLEKEIAKVSEKKETVKIAELFDESKKDKDEDKKKDEKKDEEKLTPQAKEALEVLADYVAMKK